MTLVLFGRLLSSSDSKGSNNDMAADMYVKLCDDGATIHFSPLMIIINVAKEYAKVQCWVNFVLVDTFLIFQQ